MKTIGVINLSPVGDVINSSPVCIRLKQFYKDIKLVYITTPRSYEIASCISGVDKVIMFDKKGKHNGFGIMNFVFGLQEKIDIAIVLNETFRSAMLAFLLGANKRIGRASEGRNFLLTHKIPHTAEEIDLKIHASEHYMRVLKPLGLYDPNFELELKYSEDDRDFVERLLQGNNVQSLIGISPCTALDQKDLNPVEIAKFIDFINKKADCKVVILGLEKARDFVCRLRELGVKDFIDLTCQTNASQLVALVARFKILISADSAPMHIGFALKIPTLGIFMNPVFQKWGPRSYEINQIIFKLGVVEGELIIQEFLNLAEKVNFNCNIGIFNS